MTRVTLKYLQGLATATAKNNRQLEQIHILLATIFLACVSF